MRKVRKLNLSRETLHSLTDDRTSQVAAGLVSVNYTCRIGSCTGCDVTSCIKLCQPG